MRKNNLNKKENGLIFGKFDPFHKGHEMLVIEALKQCDKVIMLVYDHPELDGIPTSKRIGLIRKIINNKKLIVKEAYNSPKPGNTPEIRKSHNLYIKNQIPPNLKIKKVFCNEWYGKDVASFLGAKLIQIDSTRKLHPVSATEIRCNLKKIQEIFTPFNL